MSGIKRYLDEVESSADDAFTSFIEDGTEPVCTYTGQAAEFWHIAYDRAITEFNDFITAADMQDEYMRQAEAGCVVGGDFAFN